MESNFSTDNVQVGDKVIVIVAGLGSSREYIGEVTKKTPTGLIDVCYAGTAVTRFNKYGRDYSKQSRFSYTFIYIEQYTEEKADIIRARDKRERIMNFLKGRDWYAYEDTELEQIYNFIKGLRNT